MTPTDMNTSDAAQVGAYAVGAIGALAAVWSKLRRSMTADRVAQVSGEAQIDVVEGLRDELERMRKQNAELATALNQAQLTTAKLQAELGRMSVEVESLQGQLTRLIARSANPESRY